SAMSFFTCANSLPATIRDACPIFTGKPRKRSPKVLVCWRDSSVVGAMMATCLPVIAVAKAARSATSVLPKPTSPQTRRSIGRPFATSAHHPIGRALRVVGLLEGNPGANLSVGPWLAGNLGRSARGALGRAFDRLLGVSGDGAFHAPLAPLQPAAAEPIKLD